MVQKGKKRQTQRELEKETDTEKEREGEKRSIHSYFVKIRDEIVVFVIQFSCSVS